MLKELIRLLENMLKDIIKYKVKNLPLLNNEEFNKANPEVMDLYWKFCVWELKD